MTPHISDRLSAYMDGALGVREIERVKAHLDICPSCLREYGELQAVQRLLRRLPDPEPRAGFLERVHWQLQREAGRSAAAPAGGFLRRISFTPLRLVLAGAALVLVLGVPVAWMTGLFAAHEAPLDTDAYFRNYLALSADRALVDEATSTFVSSDLSYPEQPTTR